MRRFCRFCFEPIFECVCPDEDPATQALAQAPRDDGSDWEDAPCDES